MGKITEMVIDGELYKHTSTLVGGPNLYRVWKYRGKIAPGSYVNVAGGLYLRADVAHEISEYGTPRKVREVSLETKIKQILADTTSKKSLVEDLVSMIIWESKEIAKAQLAMEKIRTNAMMVVKNKAKKDDFEPDVNDPNY